MADRGGRGLDGWWFRSAAIGCAFASCAMVVGPGLIGVATRTCRALRDRLLRRRRQIRYAPPAAGFRGQRAVDAIRNRSRGRRSADCQDRQRARERHRPREHCDALDRKRSGKRGDRSDRRRRWWRRPRCQHRWSGHESAACVVCSRHPQRRHPQVASGGKLCTRGCAAFAGSPSVVALAAPPPDSVRAEASQRPAGPLAPSSTVPRPKSPLAPGNSGAARIPDSYRVGYAEYLRSADTGDLFVAALPGVVGHHGIHPRRRLRGLSPGQGAAAGAPGSRANQFPALENMCACAEQWVYRFR